MPFTGPGGVGDARIMIEQVEPKKFELLEGFRYTRGATGEAFDVTPAGLKETDLTSVPFLFRWFVNAYGRHTLPALLHDCLIRGKCAKTASPRATPPTRAEADDIFLEALTDEEVPFIRRHLMWAAVTFNTRIRYERTSVKVAMWLWVAFALTGTTLVFAPWWCSWFDWFPHLGPIPLLSVAAILAPNAGARLWGSKYRAGWWFSNGIPLLGPPGVVVLVWFGAYKGLEEAYRRTFPSKFGKTSPPPSVKDF